MESENKYLRAAEWIIANIKDPNYRTDLAKEWFVKGATYNNTDVTNLASEYLFWIMTICDNHMDPILKYRIKNLFNDALKCHMNPIEFSVKIRQITSENSPQEVEINLI